MSDRPNKPVAILAAIVLSVGVPLVFRIWFRSVSSILPLLVPVALTAAAGIVRRLATPRRWWVDVLCSLPAIAFALFLLVGILITPYSSYAIWMESVRSGSPSGTVSLIFQMAFGFFSSVLAPMVLSSGYLLPLSLLAATIAGLLTVIFQSAPLTVVTLVLFAATLVVLMTQAGHRSHRLASAAFYLAAMAVCLVAGRLFSGPGKPTGSRLVDAKLYPALRQLATDVFPSLPLMYEIPGYGFSFSNKQLGGPTALSARGMFTVQGEAGSTAYLRTAVYDYYDGQSWEISQPTLTATGEDRQYMSTSFYRRGPAEPDADDILATVQAEYYSRLPTTMDATNVTLVAGLPSVEQGNMNTGILLKRPMKQGERFVIHRTAAGRPGLNGRVPPWTGSELSPALRVAYTQIPQELPTDVRELAEIINPDISDPLAVLENIQQFLAIRASYNLRPEEEGMQSTSDFVASFLLAQNPEGYCVHFATSLVILARLAGIPARYATGFLVYFPDSEEDVRNNRSVTEVRGYSSHAWPEVWLDGLGWITYEATAAVDPAYYDLYGDALQSRLRISMNRTTAAQIEALLGRHVTGQPEEARPFVLSLPPWLATVALIVLGGGVLALLGLVLSGRVRYLFLHDADRYRFQMRAMVKRFERQSLPTPERVGWVKWWDILERRRPEHARPIREARDSVLRVVYWDGYFRRRHLRELTDFRKRYERALTNGTNGHTHARRTPAHEIASE